jgi:F0F1-type ATP synthase assembly protein I
MPNSSFYSRFGRLSSLILLIPASMAAGWVIGYYVLDRFLLSFPWGSILATFLGAIAGFYETYRILISDQENKGD